MNRSALPAVIDLAAAVVLADTLRALPGSVALDGGAVERIGIAGLQVLLSAQGSAMAAGHRLVVDPASDALVAAARTAGADTILAADR